MPQLSELLAQQSRPLDGVIANRELMARGRRRLEAEQPAEEHWLDRRFRPEIDIGGTTPAFNRLLEALIPATPSDVALETGMAAALALGGPPAVAGARAAGRGIARGARTAQRKLNPRHDPGRREAIETLGRGALAAGGLAAAGKLGTSAIRSTSTARRGAASVEEMVKRRAELIEEAGRRDLNLQEWDNHLPDRGGPDPAIESEWRAFDRANEELHNVYDQIDDLERAIEMQTGSSPGRGRTVPWPPRPRTSPGEHWMDRPIREDDIPFGGIPPIGAGTAFQAGDRIMPISGRGLQRTPQARRQARPDPGPDQSVERGTPQTSGPRPVRYGDPAERPPLPEPQGTQVERPAEIDWELLTPSEQARARRYRRRQIEDRAHPRERQPAEYREPDREVRMPERPLTDREHTLLRAYRATDDPAAKQRIADEIRRARHTVDQPGAEAVPTRPSRPLRGEEAEVMAEYEHMQAGGRGSSVDPASWDERDWLAAEELSDIGRSLEGMEDIGVDFQTREQRLDMLPRQLRELRRQRQGGELRDPRGFETDIPDSTPYERWQRQRRIEREGSARTEQQHVAGAGVASRSDEPALFGDQLTEAERRVMRQHDAELQQEAVIGGATRELPQDQWRPRDTSLADPDDRQSLRDDFRPERTMSPIVDEQIPARREMANRPGSLVEGDAMEAGPGPAWPTRNMAPPRGGPAAPRLRAEVEESRLRRGRAYDGTTPASGPEPRRRPLEMARAAIERVRRQRNPRRLEDLQPDDAPDPLLEQLAEATTRGWRRGVVTQREGGLAAAPRTSNWDRVLEAMRLRLGRE